MLGVLGPLELGHGSTPRSRAQRVVASALILDAGAIVSADRLMELVWGADQPADAQGALQSHVSRLRRVLPQGVEVVARGSGYTLEVAADETDVGRFDATYRDATTAADEAGRLAAVECALALWRGTPYADLDDTRAAGERARLVEVFQSLAELKAEALVRLGRPTEAIGDLEALLSEAPLRERAVEWLMRAYVGSGRKTDALDVFTALRNELVDQKGLDPGPDLRELERQIITEEFVGFPAESAATPGLARPAVVVPGSTFVGRRDELEMVSKLLRQSRVVTLAGPGGVGKTRLATHAASQAAAWAGEVHVVELAPLRDADQLAESVASALSIQPRAHVTAAKRIIDAVGSRVRLIVLDNCEHVIEEAAQFVDVVVKAAPQVVFLTTSREALNIDAEVVVRVEPLDIGGPAVELFADRAGGMGGGGPIDQAKRPIVEQICRALDGLPLAIELAAAHTTSMTLDEIAQAVPRPLDMLGRGRRTADERHRSLRELVKWSVRDLDATQRSVFTAAAAFAGPMTASSVATVANLGRRKVGDALADLVDRSLVVVDTETGPTARFTTLETIRAYAAELLAESGDGEAMAARHGDWVLGLVDGIAGDIGRWAEAESATIVSVHLADIRLAHQRFHTTADADRALRLAASLHYEAYYGMHGEMFDWISETADRFGPDGHVDSETVLASASVGAWQAGDLQTAARYASLAGAARSTAPGAGRGAAEAGADVARFSDDQEAALELYAVAVARAREEGNQPRVVTNLADGAMVAGYLGDAAAARVDLAEARALVGANGPLACRAWLEYAEGEALAEHDPDTAVSLLTGAVDLAEQAGAAFIIGVTRLTLTGLQIRTGDPVEAVPGLIALIEHWRTRGARIQQWITMRSVVEVFLRLQAPDDAAAVLGALDGSGTKAEETGTDGARLRTGRARILADVPDGENVMAAWAARDQDAIVDHVLERLHALGRPSRERTGSR